MKLNFELYNTLKEKVKEDVSANKNDPWYQYSYNIYVNQQLTSIEDFWKFVAFAYSWMPTIPTIHFSKLEVSNDILLNELIKLKSGKANIEWLFQILTPVINNSVVGVSKTLHFIAPNVIPIYDSRVISAWNNSFEGNDELSLNKHKGNIAKVLFYTKKMNNWISKCNKIDKTITLRDLELVLYYYGKKIDAKKKLQYE
ncbi:hypothetical protein MHL31_13020 [Lutibacter sp. A80]|uniref:hypothetical protein n=1 Tax=Lutibacter sp. A80 TaxID=2918453 RepID=UPI001F06670E|nr:hypothetical protein [Lutibacter sp. A80]UMB59992.1 hypothetical protein MHL31_13020 [Lutibacter sp. A80]